MDRNDDGGIQKTRDFERLSTGGSDGSTQSLHDVVARWGPEAVAGLRRTAAVGVVGGGLAALGGWLVTATWVVHGLGVAVLQGVVVATGAFVLAVLVVGVGDRDTARAVLIRTPISRLPIFRASA